MLVRGLFGRQIEDEFLEHGFVAGLIRDAVLAESWTFATARAAELAAVSARVQAGEARFGRSLANLRSSLSGDDVGGVLEALRSQDGLQVVARTRVLTLAAQLELNVDERLVASASDRVLASFPIAIHFLRDLLVDLLAANNLPGEDWNRNSVWDVKIAFHASPGAAVAGVPILLVTNDRRFRRAADAAGHAARVVSLSEYTALLDDPTALAERIAGLRNGL